MARGQHGARRRHRVDLVGGLRDRATARAGVAVLPPLLGARRRRDVRDDLGMDLVRGALAVDLRSRPRER